MTGNSGSIPKISFTVRHHVQENPTMIEVAAVALIDESARVLLQQRRADRQHGGLWEFPGGKLEMGETLVCALLREVEEELGLVLDPADLAYLAAAEDPAAGIVITLYTGRRWPGSPRCLDAAQLGWFAAADLAQLAMPPLDVPLATAVARVLKTAI